MSMGIPSGYHDARRRVGGESSRTLYRFPHRKTRSVTEAPAGPNQPGSSCDQIFSGTLPERRTNPSGACARWPRRACEPPRPGRPWPRLAAEPTLGALVVLDVDRVLGRMDRRFDEGRNAGSWGRSRPEGPASPSRRLDPPEGTVRCTDELLGRGEAG